MSARHTGSTQTLGNRRWMAAMPNPARMATETSTIECTPVVADGHIVGAIGISGMQSAQDGVIAAAALEAFGA